MHSLNHRRWHQFLLATFCAVGGALMGLGRCALACDTPVYRYALYNWPPSPYVLYRLGATTSLSAPMETAVTADADDPAGPQTNFVEVAVPSGDAELLETLPAAVVEAWRQQGAEAPLDVMCGPQGAVVWTGALSADDQAAVVDSPARQEIVRQLGEGRPCVLLTLTGGDAAALPAAQAAVEETIARGAAGKIEPARLGSDPSAEPSAPPEVSLGQVVVDRHDPREAWLVRMLGHVEPDLAEYEGQTMVFALYGRGRAMEPYIGEGITADNLSECVSFILGSCSCQVKDQNPGVDLLTRGDWETTALAVAQQVGQEEGNEALLDAADTRLLSQAISAPTVLTGGDSPVALATLPTAADTQHAEPAPRIRVTEAAAPAEPAETTGTAFADQMGLRIALAVLLLAAVAAAGTMVMLRTRGVRRAAGRVS